MSPEVVVLVPVARLTSPLVLLILSPEDIVTEPEVWTLAAEEILMEPDTPEVEAPEAMVTSPPLVVVPDS